MANLTNARMLVLTKRFVGQRTDLDTEAGEALDAAYLRVASLRGVSFTELETLVSFNTVDGTRRYTFEAIAGTGKGRDVLGVINPVRITTSGSIGPVNYHNPSFFDRLDQSVEGKPLYFGLWAGGLELHPTPDAVYAVQVRYRKRPVKLSVASSASVLPEEFDVPLTILAGSILNALIGNFERSATLEALAVQMMQPLTTASEIVDESVDFALAPQEG